MLSTEAGARDLWSFICKISFYLMAGTGTPVADAGPEKGKVTRANRYSGLRISIVVKNP